MDEAKANLKSAAIEQIEENKAGILDFVGEKINESKTRLEDVAVEMI